MNRYCTHQRFLVIIFALGLTLLLNTVALAQGPTLDPTQWQNTATGMQASPFGFVAGLGMSVNVNSWPALYLRGGAADGGWGKLAGPTGIELGQIQIPGASTISRQSQSVDWAHNELTFSLGGSGQLKLWVSRLTPAVLVQSTASTLRLLTGNVSGSTFDGTTVFARSAGPSYPRYVAYSSGGTVQVRTLSSTALNLPALDGNWLLLWYGNNSHFVDTKVPLTYSGWDFDGAGGPPHTDAYQADAPVLVRLENRPTSIRQAPAGGVELTFSAGAGYVSLLPLLGRDHPPAATTESWAQGLPADVRQKAQWWASRLCDYPLTAAESYSYAPATDTAIITEQFTFLPTCTGGTSLAPVPPMLAIASDVIGVTFSGPVVDGNLPTEFGPTRGLENTTAYTWQISGLAAYANGVRRTGAGQPPAELTAELETQVQALVGSGHFIPWVFIDHVPVGISRGALYWANPGDVIYLLVETADALSAGPQKTALVNYIRSERNAYPPEDQYDLPFDVGTRRQGFTYYGSGWDWAWAPEQQPEAHLSEVPLFNFYALARYHTLTGDALPAGLLDKAKTVLDRDMREQDWATAYWFLGHEKHRVAVIGANRYFAGLVGVIRLAQTAGDTSTEQLGRALLAKAAVLRLGLAHYPRYLYAAGLVNLPPEPDWQVRHTDGQWHGYIFNYNWQGANDDARQVVVLNQHEVYLTDHSGYMRGRWNDTEFSYLTSPYLVAYRDMT
ncbi:MAG: hypothetical protein D6784_14685, partial [Chloroflexi bacterium]